MDINDLPAKTKFLFLALMKCAIMLKEGGKDKDFFVGFAEEVWISMEMSNFEELKHLINVQMTNDLEPYVKNYINYHYRESDEK